MPARLAEAKTLAAEQARNSRKKGPNVCRVRPYLSSHQSTRCFTTFPSFNIAQSKPCHLAHQSDRLRVAFFFVPLRRSPYRGCCATPSRCQLMISQEAFWIRWRPRVGEGSQGGDPRAREGSEKHLGVSFLMRARQCSAMPEDASIVARICPTRWKRVGLLKYKLFAVISPWRASLFHSFDCTFLSARLSPSLSFHCALYVLLFRFKLLLGALSLLRFLGRFRAINAGTNDGPAT